MNGRIWISGLTASLLLLGANVGAIAQTPAAPQAEFLLQKEGVLEEGDRVLSADNSLYDEYEFEATEGQAITITLQSEEFDTYLALLDPAGNVIQENDDISEENLNSRLENVQLPQTGTYKIIVNGYDETSRGRYSLEVSPATSAP